MPLRNNPPRVRSRRQPHRNDPPRKHIQQQPNTLPQKNNRNIPHPRRPRKHRTRRKNVSGKTNDINTNKTKLPTPSNRKHESNSNSNTSIQPKRRMVRRKPLITRNKAAPPLSFQRKLESTIIQTTKVTKFVGWALAHAENVSQQT